jgi:hypothetical protein
MKSQTWVKIEGFEEYLVNKEGQVFSTKSNRPMKHTVNGQGYEYLTITKDGKQYSQIVHTIVAKNFLGPRPEGLQVNHIDGVKTNNHVSNLEYCTPKQNSQHSVDMGLKKPMRNEEHPLCRLSDKTVKEIRKLKGHISPKYVGHTFGVSMRHVQRIWSGKSRKEVANG